jgi:hypothetical protein
MFPHRRFNGLLALAIYIVGSSVLLQLPMFSRIGSRMGIDLLADDYRTYLEIELTKGRRELTEDDIKEADTLCKRYLDRWKEELG